MAYNVKRQTTYRVAAFTDCGSVTLSWYINTGEHVVVDVCLPMDGEYNWVRLEVRADGEACILGVER